MHAGLAPLVPIAGAGAELYRGLGVVVLSGLLVSTVIALTFLPCLLVELLGRTGARPGTHAAPRSP